MKSLALKLTLAFMFISLIGIIVAAFIIQRRTYTAFDRFLYNQERNAMVTWFTAYYQVYGSWQGVDDALRQVRWQRIPANRESESLRFLVTLLDEKGVVIFGRVGEGNQVASERELRDASPIEVDGIVVGHVLLTVNPRVRAILEFPEMTFLRNVNRAVLISALIAVAVAFILGITMARTLARPIHELTDATQAIAKGKLGYQVEVRSEDELGKLAESFNRMSTDLAQANQLRRQMTADIAHDLRTPVSVVLGYTEALSDGKLEGSSEIYSIIHKETEHLNHLIEDLRTISMADSHELQLNLQKVSLATLLERCALSFKPQAEQKSIQLTVEAPAELPLVSVDVDQVARVLSNLVSNALRYTPENGWIRLSATREGQMVAMRVSDNGAGIAPEDLPLVFTRFYRGDRSRRANGEIGLGLTIAKSLVEAQGGNITVESELGVGTTFIIRLPVAG